MMALDALDLSITEVDVNMDKGEHKTPELTTLNPLQTLPIFKDRELRLSDSHAITMYLANRYRNTDSLLPRDPGGMSVVAQLMHFDSGILYPRYQAAANPILYENCNFVMPQHVADIECAYNYLETMLAGKTWLAGDTTTIADISVAATVSTLNVLVPIDHTRYPRLSSWLDLMSEEIYFITANKTGLGEFTRRIGEFHNLFLTAALASLKQFEEVKMDCFKLPLRLHTITIVAPYAMTMSSSVHVARLADEEALQKETKFVVRFIDWLAEKFTTNCI